MYYPDEIVEEVRSKSDIVDVVSSYVKIQKKGASYFGLCPFHNEKSPSFSVSGTKQMFYCFGCGAGGNVFTFLMKYENYTFSEAIKILADKAGVALPEGEYSRESREKESKRNRLLELNKEAAKYFYYQLRAPQGQAGLEYFHKRELSDETLKKFGLGYSNVTSDDLVRYLKSKGYSDDEIIDAGLGTFDEKYGFHDKFWSRVMFPISDANHRVIGFGGRVLGDGKPKYLNSPETMIFDKSRNLYGLNFARSSRRAYVILCEGYMDVISMHQAGVDCAVASLGTAFTSGQAGLLKRYHKDVVLAYDSDEAGTKAALRAIEILKEVELTGRVLHLEPYKDPDEFIKKYGSDAFRRRLKASEGQNEYTINTIIGKYTIDIPDEKSFAAREICSFIASLDSGTDRDIYTNFASSKLQISASSLAEDIERIRRSNAKKEKQKFSEDIMQNAEGYGDKINRDKVRFSSAATIEEKILGILFTHPDLGPDAAASLSASDFVTSFNSKLFDKFCDDFRNGRNANISSEGLESGEVAAISRMMAERELSADNGKAVLTELISKLKRQKEISDSDAKLKDDPSSLADYVNKLRNKK